MSIRTILAPGVQITEIDKSQYSPAMTGSNCYIMGFTDRGEPYQPMEFTNRTAWTAYYGTPDNEAERYAYAAACECLNRGGRLYFARLPYDNASFGKVAGFKYKLRTNLQLSSDEGTPFYEIINADDTIDQVTAIEPSDTPCLYDLSAIDEYRTDEAKVANNTFMIADISFNTYGKIPEDTRKNDRREMIGIMPVITTAANAMHAQRLIEVKPQNVIGFETIGDIKTVDVTKDLELVASFPVLSSLSSNVVRTSDMARILNTSDWYREVTEIPIRTQGCLPLTGTYETFDADAILANVDVKGIRDSISDNLNSVSGCKYKAGSWDGTFQLSADPTLTSDIHVSAVYSYVGLYTENQVSSNPDLSSAYEHDYKNKYGWHNPDGDDSVPDTVSQEANSFFPTIQFVSDKNGDMRFERDNLKKIGVVVYKMFLDPSEGNKINFEPVEAYAGSLRKTDKDPNTGATTFIDTIINSQSRYINFFSNCFNTARDRKYYEEDLDMLVYQPCCKPNTNGVQYNITIVNDFVNPIRDIAELFGQDISDYDIKLVDNIPTCIQRLEAQYKTLNNSPDSAIKAETLNEAREKLDALAAKLGSLSKCTTTPSLGFYAEMTKEDISVSKSILEGMTKCFEKVEDVNQLDIDIIPDAGLANIASYLKAIYGDRGQYDLQITDDAGNSLLGLWRCDSNTPAVKTWKTIEQKLDNFCKNVRKDCMFIADGLRPLVLAGQKKIVRPTKPTNTIDEHIVPYLKYCTGLNTSYGACYVDWFEQADESSGDFFWCPPSIKAMGVYINCDVNYNYWDAPAGLNRGVITATDVAFSPTIKQAGCFYEKNFNYAINYPQDGIVLEGQKTLQTKPSAFDRVNVRRLFLRLERMAFKVARYFVYEGNTAYTRQRLVDALDPYFKQALVGGGIYDYKILCNEQNNTDFTIDNNELHVAIGIKPVKTAEFIMIDFVCLRTGGSWTEAGF